MDRLKPLSLAIILLTSALFMNQVYAGTISPLSATTDVSNIQYFTSLTHVVDEIINFDENLAVGSGEGLGTEFVEEGPYTVTFDLGSEFDLTAFVLWNNGGSIDYDGEGVRQFDLNFYDSDSNYIFGYSDEAEDTLNQTSYLFANEIFGIQYVDFVIHSNWSGAPGHGGLSGDMRLRQYAVFYEVKFEGNLSDPVPEPATMILFGTGIAGLVGTRLRKKKK